MNSEKVKKNDLSNLIIRQQPWIGGPGSRLPFVVESLLGWGLALSCLSVACYHYVRQMVVVASTTLALPASDTKEQTPTTESTMVMVSQTTRRITKSPLLLLLLPLTTHSRKEIINKTTLERYQQLHQYMQKLDPNKSFDDWQEDELVTLIRSNLVLRRLVSLVMVKHKQDPLIEVNRNWIALLTIIWPRLVQLPSQEDDQKSKYDYDISIIVPAYRERGQQLFRKLQEAHDLVTPPLESEKSSSSCKIEVVVVHAHCTEMECLEALQESQSDTTPTTTTDQSKMLQFVKITCTPDVGGGRGPCLNHGAAVAKGRILTFLHADTRLAAGWNLALLKAFPPTCGDNSSSRRVVNSCAFSFAIDTSTIVRGKDYFPPGIRAVETTANLRSHWFHLPYGDQCLSVPSYVFHYVGGYPHQCLMEDYELVRLLRQRVAQLGEELKILDLPAKCHVRRWQKFGVLYVTLTNSKLVNLYSRQHITADDLFAIYYGMDAEGKDDPIPWEADLQTFLKQK